MHLYLYGKDADNAATSRVCSVFRLLGRRQEMALGGEAPSLSAIPVMSESVDICQHWLKETARCLRCSRATATSSWLMKFTWKP